MSIPSSRNVFWVAATALLARPIPAPAADLDEGRQLFRSGEYVACARLAAEEIRPGPWSEPWIALKAEAELALGHHEAAARTLEDGLRGAPSSVELRLIARRAYLDAGREEDAAEMLDEIETLVLRMPRRYATPEGRVALGRYFLLRGADARKVLEQFFDVARKASPDLVDAYLASAELALSKQDGALAAETLLKAPEAAADDPRYHYLLALAYHDGERARSEEALAKALELNPNHVDSLLLRADHRIDSERYDEAAEILTEALDINPVEPRAWAYRAVLAHLRNEPAAEVEARSKALESRPKNPEVDHLIGRKLSQKYRFAEGSQYQRRALAADPAYLPAKLQLCQDLLRLGQEEEGWALADEVFAADGYNVVAYNLITLRDRLKTFETLEGDGFVVRMDPAEAALYGDRVLKLLAEARKTLGARYGVEVGGPVVVEIFPQKKEFAVRTFGLPGADGLLGVCFGPVITACSPAAQGEDPSNWESVLWHEYGHVVTLTKTRNTMPRWLSEGISVFEEGRADRAWAMKLSPKFRTMLLGDDLTPLSGLSAAFLAPKSGLHLQFAYFESALAVEFLVERFGLEALEGLLDDLGAGKTVEEALPVRARMSLEKLDEDFAHFARRRAEAVAPGATWDEPPLPPDADSATIRAWLTDHPDSFLGRQRLAARLIAEEKWPEALDAAKRFQELDPQYAGAGNAFMMLAAVHRHRDDPAAERAALEALAALDGDAGAALLRLLELDEAADDWDALARDAGRLLAVNPLIPAPHRALATAAEHLGRTGEAIEALRAVARLDETDPAGTHFRLARLLHDEGRDDEARREVLRSLEEAPRFLDAHALLLELVGTDDPQSEARRR